MRSWWQLAQCQRSPRRHPPHSRACSSDNCRLFAMDREPEIASVRITQRADFSTNRKRNGDQ